MKSKELSQIEINKILIMLAKHYQDTKERYFDRHMNTCSVANPNRRELTAFEQSEWHSFPLIQETRLQNMVEDISKGVYNEYLESRESTFKKQIDELQSEFRCVVFKLKQADKSFTEAVSRNNSLQEKVEELQSQLAEKDKDIERLNAELKLNRADVINYKQAFDEKCCTVANLADDVDSLKSELTSLKEKADKYDKLSNKDKLRANLGKTSKWVLKALMKENAALKEKHNNSVTDFLETLHFHGYIDHDITKLKDLTEQYYHEKE